MPAATKKTLKLIGALLGFISIVNMLLLGVHITNYLLLLALFSENYFLESNIVKVVAGASIVLMIIGLFLMLKDHSLSGGIASIVSAAIMVSVYTYYSIYFPILQEFNPVGYLLLLPAPLGGAIGILVSRLKER